MKYDAPGSEDEVLPNLLGIEDRRAIELEEAQGFLRAELVLYEELNDSTVFDVAYIKRLHQLALERLYGFAGKLREVNISKGGFTFPAAKFLDASMIDFETRVLRKEPLLPASREELIAHLAIVHGELLFIHPFREGNGRTARLLADFMAMKHGFEKLDFEPMTRRFDDYVTAVQRAASGDYTPMEQLIRLLSRLSLALRKRSRASSMDSLIPSILNEAINDRNICSSETLGLREGFLSAAMTRIYSIHRDKFLNVDKSLGPEMKSTGEAIYFIKDLKDPFFRQVYGERSMYLSK